MRQVFIYPGEDGYWVAECPSLPGCVSQGETRGGAVKNIKEAIKVYEYVLKKDKIRVPREPGDAMAPVALVLWIGFIVFVVVGLLFTWLGQIILLGFVLNSK